MVCMSNPSFPHVLWSNPNSPVASMALTSISAKLRPNHHHTAAIRVQHTIASVDAEEDGTQQEQHLGTQRHLGWLKITEIHGMVES